ncbi:MAG: type IX secretion system membrane protein PorP/SprF [Cytophagales bacterium]
MKKIKITHILMYVLFFIFTSNIKSQDIQFSQFYTANLYQNPAFAGSAHAHRFMIHSRMQWLGLNKYGNNGGKYFTYFASFDTYFKKQKSGLSFMLLRDEIGDKKINSTEFYAQYSYEVHLNKRFTFKPGLQLGIGQRTYDYQNLIFPREVSDDGINDQIDNIVNGANKTFPDISSGMLFYDKKFWVGYSSHHINRPNIASEGTSRTPVKHAITGGYKIILSRKNTLNYRTTTAKEVSLTPTLHYKFQGKSDQFDLGLYGIYEFFLLGVWYRGIPFKEYKKANLRNNESIVAQTGFKWERWNFSYSYDFVISSLGGIRQSGGSHEINLTYILKPISGKSVHPTKRLPCPDFERRILNEE